MQASNQKQAKAATTGTILVPVDFSSDARNAIDYALFLAGKLKMKILLMHAYHPGIYEMAADAYKLARHEPIDATPKDLEKELEMWREAINTQRSSIECDSVFVRGSLASAVEKLVNDARVDLVIMGTRGTSRLKGALLGSNTTHVMRSVNCPVLAIPGTYQGNTMEEIVFATDYDKTDLASIKFMARLAKIFHAELTIIRLTEYPASSLEKILMQDLKERVQATVQYSPIHFRLLKPRGKDIPDAFDVFLKSRKPGLLAVSHHERNLVERFLDKSISEELAQHVPIPLMVFHLPSKSNVPW